jgi:hypothetical protein
MNTKNKWIIGIAIVIGLVILFFLPSIWQSISPASGYGYGMMGGGAGRGMMGNGGHMPMMGGYGRGGYGLGFMSFGMVFMWLIPLGLLALIGFGIAALIKYLNTKPTQ